MNKENLNKAYVELDKFTLNEAALREINRITTDGINIKLPQENIHDRLINLFDERRVILEKKSDILNNFYKDTTLARDLTLDHLNETFYYRLATKSAIVGLVSYTAYTNIVHKTPFLKAPGLAVGILGIHFIGRKLYNDTLEKKLENPWRIHSTRIRKGLGPTNFISNTHKENYGHKKRFENNFLFKQYEDYLYDEKRNLGNPKSIYVKEDTLMKNSINPLSIQNEELHLKGITTSNDINLTKEGLDILNNESKSHNENAKKTRLNYISNMVYNDIYLYPQQELQYNTFEPLTAEEIGENDYINFKNIYQNPLNFSNLYPSYAKIYLNSINKNKENADRFSFDLKMNYKLQQLMKKVHNMRKNKIDEEEIRKEIYSFNKNAEQEKRNFEINNLKIIKEDSEPKVLVHGKIERNHLEAYFNFSKANKINFLKSENPECHDFDFEIDQNNYDPWEEYKLVYKDLFEKGRKYFIVQSMPEWTFLKSRPNRYHVDEMYSPYHPNAKNFSDSIFHILSLERFHKERNQKQNLYHAEGQTHKI